MNLSSWKAIDLVNAYSYSLEQQILQRGSSLVCRDEDLCTQVDQLLRDGDSRETHCLGLDPLLEMEESLKASAADSGRAEARGGLQGLAKAFEVVEQAAINLYLGPWRKEYQFVKMYSGTFTHFVKPVLSESQVERLFGLLGYQLSSRHQQLRLQPSRVGRASPDDLLRLACAFFLARRECHLLLAALGKRVGESQWELGVVRERKKGNSLQVTVDNAKRKLDVSEPLFEGEEEVDLYTDEQINGGPRARSEDGAHANQSGTPAAALKALSNGVASHSSSSSATATAPEDVHVLTLHLQLTKMPPLERDGPNPACAKEGKPPCEESAFNQDDLQPRSQQSGAAAAPPVAERGTAASPSSQPPKAFRYHHCCDPAQLDPQVLCLTCGLFHTGSCREKDSCQKSHQLKPLGVCPCGNACQRKPLVLCRYCGSEYCLHCWFRNPLVCTCGQTFDHSHSAQTHLL